MANMIFFMTDRRGGEWFICRDCGNKEHYQTDFCPVCKNVRPHQNPEFRAALGNLIATAKKERV